jgi:transposase
VAYQAGREAIVALFKALVSAHQLETVQLTARIEQLETRLGQDSHNSHKPPSSDGPAKRPRTCRLRKHSGKKSGGQMGRPGVTRCRVDDPDAVAVRVLPVCAAGGTFVEIVPAAAQERRQVLEIPQPHLEVTEHQVVQKTCPVCQSVTAGRFSPEVAQPVRHLPRTQAPGYGPRTKVEAVYLQSHPLLPYERKVDALGDLFGV